MSIVRVAGDEHRAQAVAQENGNRPARFDDAHKLFYPV